MGVKIDLLWGFLSKNQLFEAYFDFYNPPIANFHGLCHENCALLYVGGVLELRKFGIRDLNGRFDVKKAYLQGLVAKIGYLRPILALRTHLCPKVCWRGSRAQKVRF